MLPEFAGPVLSPGPGPDAASSPCESIWPFSCRTLHGRRRGGGQMERKGRARAIAFNPHGTTVFLGNALHECEAQPPAARAGFRRGSAIVSVEKAGYFFLCNRLT